MSLDRNTSRLVILCAEVGLASCFRVSHQNTAVRKQDFCVKSSLVNCCQFTHVNVLLTFRCDIPVVFYRINTIYITSSQNTTKFVALYCTLCNTTTCFGPFSRPSSGCIFLALTVLYHDDKVYYFDYEISIILNPKQDTTLSIAANPHPRPVPIHTELLTHPP
jgi:hypothetical protein